MVPGASMPHSQGLFNKDSMSLNTLGKWCRYDFSHQMIKHVYRKSDPRIKEVKL